MAATPAAAVVAAGSLEQRLAARLERLHAADLYRVRRVVQGNHGSVLQVDGRSCINFCSNDYLGLAADPRLARAAQRALERCGTGSGGSALISGYNAEHARLEEELADFLGTPRALLFSTGWAANLGVLRGLLGRGDVLLADELNHASLIDGGRLSGADYLRVAHADLGAYEHALAQARPGTGGRETFVVSDGVFSMDGDLADLPALSRLCRQSGATLMIDDAHGFGVLGKSGAGSIEHFSAVAGSGFQRPEIHVATLGKSIGAAGAFVAGSASLIEYLVQRARSWVFSTAPPPAVAAAAREGLRILRAEPALRARLFENIERFRRGAARIGIQPGPPAGYARPAHLALPTPIQPLVLGAESRALALSRHLFERGYWVAAIRPPTVPPGTARLRITLSAAHTQEQIDGLLQALAEGLEALPGTDR